MMRVLGINHTVILILLLAAVSRPPKVDAGQNDDMDNNNLFEGDVGLQKPLKIGGKYQNPWKTWKRPGITDMFKFALFDKDRSNVPNEEELDKILPIQKPNFPEEPPHDKLELTWIGHSTVVVRLDNVSLITDPVFSQRASPSQLVGPSRYRKPACSINELPKLDAVVISHNHYDHLDYDSVVKLNERFGESLTWFVPLDMTSWMRDAGCVNVVELDWWQEASLPDKPDVKFILTPAQHWTRRGLFDECDVLWGSWTVIGPNRRFYFAGDTGYCPAFKQIGSAYGPFDVAAIPIGAYEPRGFMKAMHVDPPDAVSIHQDINSLFSVGIHWGTFSMAHEFYLEPPEKLKQTLQQRNLSTDSFVAIAHGASVLK